jgi:carboxypeptidase Q
MASEDPNTTSKEKALLPVNSRTGKRATWPEQRKATRKGGTD